VTADGIYFYNVSTKTIELLSFANDKITQVTKAKIGPFSRLAVSPDRRSILFVQRDTFNWQIILVENFRW
jgi:predicted NUDIX family phosphoesterase